MSETNADMWLHSVSIKKDNEKFPGTQTPSSYGFMTNHDKSRNHAT